jgi:hypothetical protein
MTTGAPQIGKMIRLLGSNQDGEVIAAARAIEPSSKPDAIGTGSLISRSMSPPAGGATDVRNGKRLQANA